MEDRLLQEEIAMARLNSSSEDTLYEYLYSDGRVLLKLPLLVYEGQSEYVHILTIQ